MQNAYRTRIAKSNNSHPVDTRRFPVQTKIFILFVASIFSFGCNKSTEPSNSIKGSITGKVFNSISQKGPSQPISITLDKINSLPTVLDSIRSTLSNSSYQYSFTGLDTGRYLVKSNIDLYVKTGYASFVELTTDSLNQQLDVPFDTVKTRP
jgi:hypothetical protein